MLEDCKRIMKKNSRLFIVDILVDEVNRPPACMHHLTTERFFKLLNQQWICFD